MNPVVLHHGLFGGDSQLRRTFRPTFGGGIEQSIAAAGYPVYTSAVHPTAGVITRANQLRQWLLSIVPKIGPHRLTIIAHSLGGLDARYMLARMDMAHYVDALVTITTPHRGSPYADWCAEHLGRRLRGFDLVRRCGLDFGAITDLTTERCARFNEEIRDVPGVRYFSVSAARPWRQVPPWGMHSGHIVNRLEGPNDGLVSVRSSTWGTHLGVWQADHWHTINQRYALASLRDGDISPQYLSVLSAIHAMPVRQAS